ncbi:MAG: class I SAM-dependent methyltransferase [Bacteroidia bacterium]|nr:class I SAM-dependent methyltransferase [Bacteroidia bacterium]NNJ56816.1 class I SAM-dependent methyltransferase [Bacteroidia bacterium]
MLKYRDTIYNNYFSNQVNKLELDHSKMLAEQASHNGAELIGLLPSNKNAKIVDLGCGFGTFVKPALDAGYTNVTGYDISKEQVKVANQLGLDTVYESSIEDYFAKGEKADVIVGLDIIEHFTKDELITFLVEVKKHLNPGGKAIFRTPNMDAPQTSIYAYGDISHEVFLNKSSALQVMSSVGFPNTSVFGGLLRNTNPLKEFIRKLGWWKYKTFKKIVLFCTARTWHNVVFEPNLLIVVEV